MHGMSAGLPDVPRRNTGDFCPSIHPGPVRPMCRYIIPRACCHPNTNSTQAVNTAKILIGLKWKVTQVCVQPRYLGCQRDIARICCCGPGLRRCCCRAPGAVDRYLLRVRCSAVNPPHAAAAFDWWDRLTDGRTLDRFIDPAPHTMRTVSKSESSCQIVDAQLHWIFCEDTEYSRSL